MLACSCGVLSRVMGLYVQHASGFGIGRGAYGTAAEFPSRNGVWFGFVYNYVIEMICAKNWDFQSE